MKKKPSLVAPGGSYTKAIVAAKYGADEIYVGVPFTSLRMRQNKIKTFDDLKKTVDDIHSLGKKALLTMNIFPRNRDIKVFEATIDKISDIKPDGIIFSDLGTYKVIKKYFPNVPLHLSTQTTTLNYEAVRFWADLGVKRIVAARELSLEEIKEIKKNVPEMEIEVFVHGAMCIAYSGRCLMGLYMNGRDANKGECAHNCRFNYKVYLEEERRSGKLFEVGVDENGTYMLSSKDLKVIDRLDELIDIVDAMKIEGRSKSEFYVGATVKAYRHVLDSLYNGEKIDEEVKNLVYQIPHRPYWDGFLFNSLASQPDGECEIDSTTAKYNTAGPLFTRNYFMLVLPEFIEKDGKKYLKVIPKENIFQNMKLNYISPDNMGEIKILDILDEKGNTTEKLDCNKKFGYVLFDKKLNGWEIIYKKIDKLN